jgi:N-acetylneuraminic acid mutarotase
MKKKSVDRGAFLTRRTIFALTIFGVASSLLAGSLLGFLRGDAASKSPRTLTFAERVAYQRAIEDVYWRHRIWPKERPDPKPPLDAVISDAQLEKKVADYLRKSKALADYWHQPLTAEQLQAEMNRMAEHSKQPEVLRELFAALGNDPFVIAECLARPAAAERLLISWYAYDETIHGELAQRAEAQLQMHSSIEQMKETSGIYSEIELLRGDTARDKAGSSGGQRATLNSTEWEQTTQRLATTFTKHAPKSTADANESIPIGKLSALQEDETRYYATAVLNKTTGHLKVAAVAWLKEPLASWLARAENGAPTATKVPNGNYTVPATLETVGSCTDNTWTATSGPPDGRVGHTAVWTGSEMIVWGGNTYAYPYNSFNNGGRYNPATDNWTTTSTTNAPAARYAHTAVWTGSEMIIWGGIDGMGAVISGGRYNSSTDSWTATSMTNAPSARSNHTAVWTGTQMIVWGGLNNTNVLNTGGKYNPGTDSWTATSTASAPTGGYGHTAVWSGSEMIVWGGVDSTSNFTNTGARYNPSTNSWTATTITNAPDSRAYHTAAWTGTAMIIWGGDNGGSPFNTGGRYYPSTNSWVATAATNAPAGRSGHTAVWNGSEMIIWGGFGTDYFNTGGRYNPNTNSWTATSTANAPTGRGGHTAVWSGSEMIVWGGSDSYDYSEIGGRYNPVTNTWTITGKTPNHRAYHVAVWTGSEMIVWGGNNFSDGDLNTGGRYNPATDSWMPTSITNAPAARFVPTAVWTGSEMIVWGGFNFNDGDVNTGGRYNPVTDSWQATSTTNAPVGRESHTAVWTGSRMVVWGGYYADPYAHELNTGGNYDPVMDSWTATTAVAAPSARDSHGAVWTGSEMIVWGGLGDTGYVNTGGRYNPSTDVWTSTSTANAPSARSVYGEVWTGSEMIIWGGHFFDINGDQYLNSGGRYNPNTDTWTATSTVNAPDGRTTHTAVWTGSDMIVWGGQAGFLGYYFNTGGRYDPSTDSWTATSTANAPAGRFRHTAVWTGNQMIVWGGILYSNNYTSTGRRYCAPRAQLGNISTRAFVQTADNVMIGGFIVQGTPTKKVIIRAIGPELGAPPYNVPGALADPTLELHDATGALIASNDSWHETIIGGVITSQQWVDILNSGYVPGDARESAIIAELPAGNYTAIVRGVNNTTGVALVEVYDLSSENGSILSNISTRSFVQTADNVMIGGLIVNGTTPKEIIVRAIGPELSAPPYNVPSALANPTLELHDSSGALVASNDNWTTTIIGGIITSDQVADIRNSGHAPTDARESAIIATLQPGNYTAIVRGVDNMTGVALVEVYDLH